MVLASERGAAPWIREAADLLEAAGARVAWRAAAETAAAVERALGESDAVVVAARPAALAGERFARRFHAVVRGASRFGSSAGPRSLRHLDLLLVGALHGSAAAWERSARIACAWARDEGRERVHCAVRDPRWPILASDRAIRFRRIALDGGVEAVRTTFHDARRRVLFDSHPYEVLVADAADVDALARTACAGAGWYSSAPSLFVGEECALLDLDLSNSARASSAEAALAAALALVRLLRRLGEASAAARMAAAIRGEVAERLDLARDLWLDLASDTPSRFLDAVRARLAGRPSVAR